MGVVIDLGRYSEAKRAPVRQRGLSAGFEGRQMTPVRRYQSFDRKFEAGRSYPGDLLPFPLDRARPPVATPLPSAPFTAADALVLGFAILGGLPSILGPVLMVFQLF